MLDLELSECVLLFDDVVEGNEDDDNRYDEID
jgi:hypothetical protein